MSYNDLTQNEKRSLLLNAMGFNRACALLACALKADLDNIESALAEDTLRKISKMSDDEINFIINKIQQTMDKEDE